MAGIIDRLFSKRGVHPRDPAPAEWFGGAPSASGVNVTATNAMTVMAVYAAVRVIAEALSSLPLFVYKSTGERSKSKDRNHPLYSVVHDKPNDWQTSMEFREMMQGHLLLRGNAYAQIVSTGGNPVEQLIPLHPDRVVARRERLSPGAPYKIWYEYHPIDGGKTEIFLQGEVFHLRGLSSDGFLGLSPIALARDTVGLAIAAEQHGARFFANGAEPGGVLQHPNSLSKEARKNLKESWERAHSGANSHRIAVLEEGLTWQKIGLSNADIQFLESRKFQVTEIARMFRVPPHLLMDLDKATFSNIEHQSLDFVIHTIRPWVVRWEQRMKVDLLTSSAQRTRSVEFLIDGLLRADQKSRYESYQIGRTGGWLSANDVRELENMNPLDGDQGDVYMVPLNMIPADQLQELARGRPRSSDASGSTDGTTDSSTPVDPAAARSGLLQQRLERAHARLFADAASRALRKELLAGRRALDRAKTEGRVGLEGWVEDFYDMHAETVVRALLPSLHTAAEAIDAATAEMRGTTPTDTGSLMIAVQGVANDIASRYVSRSRGQILGLLRDTGDDTAYTAIAARFALWETNRADQTATDCTIALRAALTILIDPLTPALQEAA